MPLQSFFSALALALVHMVAGSLRSEHPLRPAWVSFAGGVAAAYVFVHILPALNRMSGALGQPDGLWPAGEWIFASALAGMCAYYAVEHATRPRDGDAASPPTPARRQIDFWVHIGAFALYNGLVGYLLVDHPDWGPLDDITYQAALMLHFVVIDQDLRARHTGLYDRFGRWIMASAVIVGWGLGALDLAHGPLVSGAFAFLAGGMILNVLKEELTEAGHGRLAPFLAGAAIFGGLFLLARSGLI